TTGRDPASFVEGTGEPGMGRRPGADALTADGEDRSPAGQGAVARDRSHPVTGARVRVKVICGAVQLVREHRAWLWSIGRPSPNRLLDLVRQVAEDLTMSTTRTEHEVHAAALAADLASTVRRRVLDPLEILLAPSAADARRLDARLNEAVDDWVASLLGDNTADAVATASR